jgi:hypothetical protein
MLLSAPISTPTFAVNVAITNYRAAWVSTANYGAGTVITYNGASYISLVANNKNRIPSSSPGAWGILNTPGATGPTGPRGPTGPTGPAGPAGGGTVFDSNGKVVGGWLHPSGVILKVAGITFWARAYRTGFSEDTIGFASTNCTGTVYEIYGNGASYIARYAVVQDGIAYVTDGYNPDQIPLFSIKRYGTGVCENAPNSNGGYDRIGSGHGTATAIVDLSSFVPPFTVQLQ